MDASNLSSIVSPTVGFIFDAEDDQVVGVSTCAKETILLIRMMKNEVIFRIFKAFSTTQ
jgi:hypothetical protein